MNYLDASDLLRNALQQHVENICFVMGNVAESCEYTSSAFPNLGLWIGSILMLR